MHRKEGVNQGYPLAMISFGIGILHLIRELRGGTPQVSIAVVHG